MKAPAYKITFKDNTHAVLAERLLEEEHDMPVDIRDGKTLILSKEWMDINMIDQNDLEVAIQDVCMVGETDYTPDVIIDEEYDWSLDEYERVQDAKDSEKGFSPSFAENEGE